MKKTLKDVQDELEKIDNIRDKLGETIYDCIQEDGNFTTDIGKSVLNCILDCNSQNDLDRMDEMLTAISGYSLDSVLNRIAERDESGYIWESFA